MGDRGCLAEMGGNWGTLDTDDDEAEKSRPATPEASAEYSFLASSAEPVHVPPGVWRAVGMNRSKNEQSGIMIRVTMMMMMAVVLIW